MKDTAALDALFEPYRRSDAPGLVVGVARHGETLYRRAFGLASIEHGVANGVRTRMRIGSASKQFTCLAALLLAEEGKLDLDTGVRRWLPELPALWKAGCEPTLRQLMQHTGGMRDSLDLGFLASGMTIKPKGESMAVQLRQRALNFLPGENILYNNGGYHMLSQLVARVSGMSFEGFLAERIFKPLGMVDTESVPSDLAILPGVATLHVPQADGGWRRGLFPSQEVLGEGAIVSTVDDMLRWLAHLRAPGIVGSADSWTQMLAPARLNSGAPTSYALGLMVERYRGVKVVHHGGTVIGGHCQMLCAPEAGVDIILMSNGVKASLFDLGNQVLEAVLGKAAFTRQPDTPAQTADYQPLLGTVYASPGADLVVGFGDAGGKLGLVLHNLPPIPMRTEPGALWLDFNRSATGPYRVAIAPLAPQAAAPSTLALEESGMPRQLERLGAAPPLRQAGQPVAGRYRAPELNAAAAIAFEDERLLLRIAGEHGPSVLELTPYSHEIFAWKFTGELAPLGGTLSVERSAGKLTGLRLHTLRTRHLHLQRIED